MPRRALFVTLAAAVVACAVAEGVACSSEEDPDPFGVGSSSGFVRDGAAPTEEASVSPGRPCGNDDGLEQGSPWPLRGGCPKRAGFAQRPGPTSTTTSWSLSDPAGHSSPAITSKGIAWIGTHGGDVLALRSGGTLAARFQTNDAGADAAVRSSAAISKAGAAVIAGADGVLYGLDVAPAIDGGLAPAIVRFSLAIGPMASSPAIGADGTIYVGTTDGRLVAVATGGTSVVWTATTNDTEGASPALGDDGTIYVGSSDRKLYAFAPSGAPKWSLDLGAAIAGVAVGGDETIYAGTTDGTLAAVSPAGASRWTYRAGGAITGGPSVYAGRVYVGSADRKLHALSTIDGKLAFAFETLGAVATPIVASDEKIYVGSTDGKLYALLPSGSLFFAANAQGPVRGAPALGADGVIVVTTDNGVVAIGP